MKRKGGDRCCRGCVVLFFDHMGGYAVVCALVCGVVAAGRSWCCCMTPPSAPKTLASGCDFDVSVCITTSGTLPCAHTFPPSTCSSPTPHAHDTTTSDPLESHLRCRRCCSLLFLVAFFMKFVTIGLLPVWCLLPMWCCTVVGRCACAARVRPAVLRCFVECTSIPVNGDYERLVRHLTGKARGVVLGGGGARGLAHLGVLATLEEQGLPVDYIGGTSQGAFMAGLYALTLDVQECFPLSKILSDKIGTVASMMRDVTLPIMSYFSGELFNEAIQVRMCSVPSASRCVCMRVRCAFATLSRLTPTCDLPPQDVFKDVQIEDLWINYFCITTNVTKESMGVHEAGCMWRHCRASMTVNGLLPPMVMDGDVVVDGGYVLVCSDGRRFLSSKWSVFRGRFGVHFR